MRLKINIKKLIVKSNPNSFIDDELNKLLIIYFNNLSLTEVELNIINSDIFLNSKLYINNI